MYHPKPFRVLVEREVTLSDFEHLGFPNIFESQGLLSLVRPPDPANVQIVKEFYDQVPRLHCVEEQPDSSFDVRLRGITLNFSINQIAMLLNLPRPPSSASIVNRFDVDLVESKLVGQDQDQFSSKILTYDRLTEFYKILNSIASVNIDPRDPADELSLIHPDRASLLYAIGNNVPVDLPAYIYHVIYRAPRFSSIHFFPFGSLITRFAMAYHVRIEPTDQIKPPMPPINKNMFPSYTNRSETSAAALNPPVLLPASEPSSPMSDKLEEPPEDKLNQPLEAFQEQVLGHLAQFKKDIAKLTGDMHAIYMHLGIPVPSKQPSTEAIMEVEEESDGNLIPNSPGSIPPSITDSHQKQKPEKDSLAQAMGEVTNSPNEILASQKKPQLRGEEVHGVVSKIPNLRKLQAFKAVRILLSGNPEEFSLLKSLPDVDKIEWIQFLISESEGQVKRKASVDYTQFAVISKCTTL